MKAKVVSLKGVRELKFSKETVEYQLEVSTPYGLVEHLQLTSKKAPIHVGDEVSVVVRSSLQRLCDRLGRIGVDTEFACNAPWVYLEKINGIKITEKRWSDYGYTVFFLPMRRGQQMKFTKGMEGRREFFALLRAYLGKTTS